MIKIGSVLLPADYFGSEFIREGNQGSFSIVPGVCPPIPIGDNESDGVVTTPIGHGQAHAYGFSDLMVVEQELSHYELRRNCLYRKCITK